MEKVKVQKKRAFRWSEVEIDALLTAVESNRKQILGSFSSEVTLNSKQNAWKIVAFKVSWCFSSSVLGRSLAFLRFNITISLLRSIVRNLFDVKRVSRGLELPNGQHDSLKQILKDFLPPKARFS